MSAREAFQDIGPDRLRMRDGGGCLSLFGVPFFLAGVFAMLIGTGVVRTGNAADVPLWVWWFIFLVGLAFAAAGGGLMLGRRWITIDKARGVLCKQWGLLVPMKGDECNLQDFEAVLLRVEAGNSDTADRYPVLLKGKPGRSDLRLTSSPAYGEARERGAAVARFLGVQLIDATTDHVSATAPDGVEATFQERVRAGDVGREEAVRPLRMQSQVRDAGSTVEIVLPSPGLRPAGLVGVAVSTGLLMYVASDVLRVLRRTNTPDGAQWTVLGLAVFLFVLGSLRGVIGSVLTAVRGRTVVTASAQGIVIAEPGVWRTKTTRIAAADILGLDYGTGGASLQSARRFAEQRLAQAGRLQMSPGQGRAASRWLSLCERLVKSRGIVIKSRNRLITFGAGLPDEEVRYLYAIVARALGGPEGCRW